MKGWYNQKWRHALAARGVKTNRFAARRSLMTGEEISMLRQMNGDNLASMSDSEIQDNLSKIRAEPRSDFSVRQQQAPQVPMQEKKVDWMEPFRSPEEKSEVGRDMIEREIQKKIEDADRYMTSKGIDFEDKKRIMDHYVYPLAEKFRQGGISAREFDQAVDSKVSHNTGVSSKSLGAFDWSKKNDGEKDEWKGAFNFIDKAQKSRGW
jgi:hypothetical protein